MNRQSGFTIIEVLLFLSISGLLLMFAIVSFTATIQNTRFTEATNSIEGFISQQYNDIRSGVSYRTDVPLDCGAGSPQAPGAANNCIVIGRLLDIRSVGTEFGTDANSIKTYLIVGNRCPDVAQPTENNCQSGSGSCPIAPSDTSVAAKIASYCPRIIPDTFSEDFELPWGTHLPQDITVDSAPQPNPRSKRSAALEDRIDKIAIIHSPTSERIYTFTYDGPTINDTVIQPIDRQYLTGTTADKETLLCLKSSDLLSSFHYVSIGAGQGSDLINSGDAISTTMLGTLKCS